MKRLMAIAALVTAITGCGGVDTAGTGGESLETKLAARNLQAGEPVKEILNSRINGWNSLDDRNLIVQTGPGSQYLVSLMTRCNGLRSSENVAFTSTTGRVTSFDALLVEGPGDIVDRCPITSIRELVPTEQP